jgi:hypothetical protein
MKRYFGDKMSAGAQMVVVLKAFRVDPVRTAATNAKTEDTSFKVEASVRLNRPLPNRLKKAKETLSESFLPPNVDGAKPRGARFATATAPLW